MKIHRFIFSVIFLISINNLQNVSTSENDTLSLANASFNDMHNRNSNASVTAHKDEIVKLAVLESSIYTETPAEILNEKDVKENGNAPVFQEIFTQNPENTNEIINNDTPIVLPLTDTATIELQQRADILLHTEQLIEKLSNTTINLDTSNEHTNETNPHIPQQQIEANYRTDEIPRNITEKLGGLSKNGSVDEVTEEIPSFSEWAQKHLEEVEKKEQANSSVQGQNMTSSTKQGSKRWKNYASLDCGAKVVLANPEAGNPWAILSPSKDEYKLNTCTNRIWFIVELCEAIQLKKIDLANYELFSSSPKDFAVWVSDRFPTRDWLLVGHFTAKDERGIQNFDVNHEIFGKYIKVEIKSHYGSEHYCPLSLFRAYGTSVFEVLQKEDPAHVHHADDDDDDDDDTLADDDTPDASKNILSSATDAVISMVKKAAEALGNKVINNQTHVKMSNSTFVTYTGSPCRTPSHYVVCDRCDTILFDKVFELVSCRTKQLTNLVNIPLIRNVLMNTSICQNFGIVFNNTTLSHQTYINLFFTQSYLAALCNSVAVLYNKVSLNMTAMSMDNDVNVTYSNNVVDNNDSVQPLEMSHAHDSDAIDDVASSNMVTTAPLTIENVAKASCSTDTSQYTTKQIKPSKSLLADVNVQIKSSLMGDANTKVVGDSHVVILENNENPELPATPEVTGTVSPSGESEDSLVETSGISSSSSESGDLDNFMNELNGDASQNSGSSNGGMAATNANMLQAQKESVFLRLSNRIKALERNASLTSQYLEELSKRFKKVEETQRLTEKSLQSLHEKTKEQLNELKHLQQHMDTLRLAIDSLTQEKHFWITFFIILHAFTMFFLVFPRIAPTRSRTTDAKSPESVNAKSEVHRRKSVDVLTHGDQKSVTKKVRRPSDQAMKIVTKNDKSNMRKRKKPILGGEKPPKIPSVAAAEFAPQRTSSKLFCTSNHVRMEEITPITMEDSEHTSLDLIEYGELTRSKSIKQKKNSKEEQPVAVVNNATYVKEKIMSSCGDVVNGLDENNTHMELVQYLRQQHAAVIRDRIENIGDTPGSMHGGGTDDIAQRRERKKFKKLFKGFLGNK